MCAAACFSPFPQSKLTFLFRKPDSRNLESVGNLLSIITKYVLCVVMSFSVKQSKQLVRCRISDVTVCHFCVNPHVVISSLRGLSIVSCSSRLGKVAPGSLRWSLDLAA